jgi:tyrosyl-tRNA synthetase
MTAANVAQQLDLLCDGCVEVVTREDLGRRLAQGRPLRVKLGIDPTGPLLHLGHAVVLRKLRQFQDLGHEAILIVGDFTGQIGDPTGRQEARKPRTREEIEEDMRTYVHQAALVIDTNKARIKYNSEWLARLSFAQVIEMSKRVTVARMLERDDFATRYSEGAPIGLDEFLYPLSVAYDSVATQADVELGGTEQLFNLLAGRKMQEDVGQPPQVCMTLPILEGTDGVIRMGKSLNNYIALRDPPNDMFGKVMSVPDTVLVRYWRLATTASRETCDAIESDLAAGKLTPRDAKLRLAHTIVALYHGETAAAQARDYFEKTIMRKELPDDVPPFHLPPTPEPLSVARLLVLLGWAESHREAQRLVRQGAVKIDGEKVADPKLADPSWDGKVLQKGNHQFARLVSRR